MVLLALGNSVSLKSYRWISRMESNKKSSEFNFLEATMAKRTELLRTYANIVVEKGNVDVDILFLDRNIEDSRGWSVDKLIKRGRVVILELWKK